VHIFGERAARGIRRLRGNGCGELPTRPRRRSPGPVGGGPALSCVLPRMSHGPVDMPTDRAQRLERLLAVGRALTSELDLDLLLERILLAARELTGARYAALGVLDDERRELARFVTSGIDEEGRRTIGELPRGRGILGLLIDQPEPIRLHDVSEHPRSYGFPPGHPPMRGFLGVPVVVRGEAWGNLYLTEREDGRDFDDEDEQAIVVLAEWAAVAVDNARLFGATERRRSELERAVRTMEATMDIALALGGETDLQRILELIVKRARALVEADALIILLRSGDRLRLAAGAGRAQPSGTVEIPIDGSSSGRVLETLRAERIADVPTQMRIGADAFGLPEARTALLVPLAYRGRGLGVLAAFDHLGEQVGFAPEDERALRSFAASAATAVAAARTVEEQRLRDSLAAAEAERKRWARELHDETLQGLGALKLALSSALRGDPERGRGIVEEAVGQLEQEIAGLRAIITDLRPAALDELGLEPALRTLVARTAERHGLQVAARIELGDERLPPEIETLAYRVTQEALTNVVKHAGASRAEVCVRRHDGTVTLEISDDGAGLGARGAHRAGGFGVLGMRERAVLAGGRLEIAGREHGGTSVVLEVPVG
jgi:signal transduction histidine kinase